MGLATDSEMFHFSTDDLPERDRTTVWREVFGQQIIKVQWEGLPDTHFSYAAKFRKMPGLSIAVGESSAFRAERTPQLAADGNDDLLLTINTEGFAYASQFGREARIESSAGFLMSAAETSTILYPESARWIVIGVPRKTICAMVSNPERVVGEALRQTDTTRLLVNYVSWAGNGIDCTNPKLRQIFVTHVQDLFSLALGTTRDGDELARGRGLRAARLVSIKADIMANLSRRELSAEMIGRLQGLTASYIRKLFASEDISFTDYVLEQRLLFAYRRLNDSHFADRSISALAYEAGFGDLSYFNRTFRRRFGITPSEARDAAGQK